jgi:hypothetical protein
MDHSQNPRSNLPSAVQFCNEWEETPEPDPFMQAISEGLGKLEKIVARGDPRELDSLLDRESFKNEHN